MNTLKTDKRFKINPQRSAAGLFYKIVSKSLFYLLFKSFKFV